MARIPLKIEKQVHDYLAEIGHRGGVAGRRELSRREAKQMVAIREALRAARKKGRTISVRERKRLMRRAADTGPSPRRRPSIRKTSFPS